MRGKKAKALRREAYARSVGLPSVIYMRDLRDNWTIVLGKCTRKVYQDLKRK